MKFFLLFVVVMPLTAFAQRIEADLQCRYTGKDFSYDCTVRLAEIGRPLSGAQFSIGADMPSMPMAHNIRPVKAIPGPVPGEYRALLDLEMQGEWAVKLRLSAPVVKQLVLHYEFGAQPARHQARKRGAKRP